jgi:hypothetical protein
MKPSTLVHPGLAACFLCAQASTAATIAFVGNEVGNAGNGFLVQNWSNSAVAKNHDIDGNNQYGSAGYYQIRPMPWDPGAASIGEAVGSGNDLGVSSGSNPTLSLAPVFLSSITGGAGTYVNYGGYPIFRGPDGSALYRQGSLSVSVGTGPFNTPSGTNNGYFGQAFSFTVGTATTFRVGITVDTAANGIYAPDYVSIFSSSTGTVFSSLLTRDGTPDMAIFDITAAAGESFTAAVWQLSGTQSVAPFGLVTFDVIPEPSGGLLVFSGLAVTGLLHRRRRTS